MFCLVRSCVIVVVVIDDDIFIRIGLFEVGKFIVIGFGVSIGLVLL